MKRHHLNVNDYQAFVRQYHNETDRAAIVMAGSFVENYLATYIRHFTVPDEGVEQLFAAGPLASFDARINIAYAFSLISKIQRDDLKIIKWVRNYFAHSPRVVSLGDEKVKLEIQKLSILATIKDAPGVNDEELKPRNLYLFSIGLFVLFADQKMGAKWTLPNTKAEKPL